MSRMMNATSASGSRGRRHRLRRLSPDFGEHALRIEARNIGGQIRHGERQIAGDAHERPHAHHFVVADPRHGRDADHLARDVRLFGRPAGGRSCARRADRSPAAERAAQRDFDALRHAAKLVSPSSDVKTAPPMRAAPDRAVRIVPANHCTETRRRSTQTALPPSTESGGSLPSSIDVAMLGAMCAARSRLIQARCPLARDLIMKRRPRARTRGGTMPGGSKTGQCRIAARIFERCRSPPVRPSQIEITRTTAGIWPECGAAVNGALAGTGSKTHISLGNSADAADAKNPNLLLTYVTAGYPIYRPLGTPPRLLGAMACLRSSSLEQ